MNLGTDLVRVAGCRSTTTAATALPLLATAPGGATHSRRKGLFLFRLDWAATQVVVGLCAKRPANDDSTSCAVSFPIWESRQDLWRMEGITHFMDPSCRGWPRRWKIFSKELRHGACAKLWHSGATCVACKGGASHTARTHSPCDWRINHTVGSHTATGGATHTVGLHTATGGATHTVRLAGQPTQSAFKAVDRKLWSRTLRYHVAPYNFLWMWPALFYLDIEPTNGCGSVHIMHQLFQVTNMLSVQHAPSVGAVRSTVRLNTLYCILCCYHNRCEQLKLKAISTLSHSRHYASDRAHALQVAPIEAG